MEWNVILRNFLDANGKLTAFPAKRKMKVYCLFYLAGKFEAGREYTEREVNELLLDWHTFADPATLRRGCMTTVSWTEAGTEKYTVWPGSSQHRRSWGCEAVIDA